MIKIFNKCNFVKQVKSEGKLGVSEELFTWPQHEAYQKAKINQQIQLKVCCE